MIRPITLLVLGVFGVPGPLLPAADATAEVETLRDVRAELETMLETDQSQRNEMSRVEKAHGRDSPEMRALWETQHAFDAQNIARLEAIIAVHGWPKRSVVGVNASTAAFLVLQHADLPYQQKYLPLVRLAVAADELDRRQLPLLEDRVRMREGRPQLYGTQLSAKAGGPLELHPIEDEANLDARRASAGLPPIAEYLAAFGLTYQPPGHSGKSSESPPP